MHARLEARVFLPSLSLNYRSYVLYYTWFCRAVARPANSCWLVCHNLLSETVSISISEMSTYDNYYPFKTNKDKHISELYSTGAADATFIRQGDTFDPGAPILYVSGTYSLYGVWKKIGSGNINHHFSGSGAAVAAARAETFFEYCAGSEPPGWHRYNWSPCQRPVETGCKWFVELHRCLRKELH